MRSTGKDEISFNQQQRLEFIDFALLFLGRIGRTELIEQFGISSAAATRDFALYKKLAPKNIGYDTKQKEYCSSENFISLYDHNTYEALRLLSELQDARQDIVWENPVEINTPSLPALSEITRAIHQHKAVKITYLSLSSTKGDREIVPFALVNSGTRWHVRGFDRKRHCFNDFVINRIKKASLLHESEIKAHEQKEADIQWSRIVEMELTPHPNLSTDQKEAISYEYGMQNGILKVNIRAAVSGYFLRRWNVDCSSDHRLTKNEGKAEFQLWLKNHLILYGVESATIAPGYSKPT